ncbi:hypothetical protein FACS1894216_21490 [Synergistales bacterium]|nr:hypothetical protein FACS1894216_21490 [Synergistales bacterium]
MNYWTELSIKFANQSSYLDELFRIYPMSPEFVRDIDEEKWGEIEDSFNLRDNINLIENSKYNILSALFLRDFLCSI